MKILCYSARKDKDEKRLLEKIRPVKTELWRSFDKLRDRLNIPASTGRIIVFLVRTEEEIAGISEWIELYFDLQIVLILHDQEPATLRAAHKIRPRYICTADGDFNEIAGVVQRLDKLHGRRNRAAKTD